MQFLYFGLDQKYILSARATNIGTVVLTDGGSCRENMMHCPPVTSVSWLKRDDKVIVLCHTTYHLPTPLIFNGNQVRQYQLLLPKARFKNSLKQMAIAQRRKRRLNQSLSISTHYLTAHPMEMQLPFNSGEEDGLWICPMAQKTLKNIFTNCPKEQETTKRTGSLM